MISEQKIQIICIMCSISVNIIKTRLDLVLRFKESILKYLTRKLIIVTSTIAHKLDINTRVRWIKTKDNRQTKIVLQAERN